MHLNMYKRRRKINILILILIQFYALGLSYVCTLNSLESYGQKELLGLDVLSLETCCLFA
jgi:hypothetical protein